MVHPSRKLACLSVSVVLLSYGSIRVGACWEQHSLPFHVIFTALLESSYWVLCLWPPLGSSGTFITHVDLVSGGSFPFLSVENFLSAVHITLTSLSIQLPEMYYRGMQSMWRI